MLPSSGRRFAARAMSGTELSRVPTELRLLPPEAINKSLIASRGADIVMQSSGIGPVSTLPITAFAKHLPNNGEHKLCTPST